MSQCNIKISASSTNCLKKKNTEKEKEQLWQQEEKVCGAECCRSGTHNRQKNKVRSRVLEMRLNGKLQSNFFAVVLVCILLFVFLLLKYGISFGRLSSTICYAINFQLWQIKQHKHGKQNKKRTNKTKTMNTQIFLQRIGKYYECWIWKWFLKTEEGKKRKTLVNWRQNQRPK